MNIKFLLKLDKNANIYKILQKVYGGATVE